MKLIRWQELQLINRRKLESLRIFFAINFQISRLIARNRQSQRVPLFFTQVIPLFRIRLENFQQN